MIPPGGTPGRRPGPAGRPLVSPARIPGTAAELYAARSRARAWQADPVAWAARRGIELYSMQREILTAVATKNRVAVRSAHDTGKSFSMAVLVAWWLDVHERGTARVVTTAPSSQQVRGILWVEINGLWDRLDLPGTRNQTEIWFDKYQAAVGRKAADYNPAAFSGWHAPHLLVIVDEADGVGKRLWGAIDTLVTNESAKVVAVGNPDDPQSEFRRRQDDQPFGGGYHTIKVPAAATPNFSHESVSQTLRDALLSPRWVEEMRIAWGGRRDDDRPPDHPFWSSKVEAEYPDESGSSVIRLADLLRARRSERTGPLAAADDRFPVRVGIDVAGSEHGDASVVRGVRGLRVLGQQSVRLADPQDLEDWLVARCVEFDAHSAFIDADGIGHGFAGGLRRRRGQQMAVHAIRSSASAADPKAFLNRRAEMWWSVREALAGTGDSQVDATILDEAVAGQLLLPRYSTGNSSGRIQLESKDDLRKRLGRSPDDADALVYVTAKPKGGGVVSLHQPRGSLTGGR